MRALLAMTALAVLVMAAPAAAADDCAAARCLVQQEINDTCSCDVKHDRYNHGRYVSCVAHVVKRLADSGAIPTNCKGKIKRCAARSTCGKKAGFVTCQIPTDTCVLVSDTCDPGTLTCTADPTRTCAADEDCTTGTCAADPALACSTDLDCGARCSIKSSAARCEARGGIVDPSKTTCCSNCSAAP